MSQMFVSNNQKTTVSALASVLPMSIQGCFPLKLTGLISLLSKRLLGIFSCTTVWKHQLFGTLPSLWFISHNHMWPLWKIIALTIQTFVGRLMSLLVNTLSRFVIAFLPRRNCLLISWLQSTSAVLLEPKKRKCHHFHLFPFYCHKVMRLDAIILVFFLFVCFVFSLIFSFKPALSLSFFTVIKRLFNSSLLSVLRVVSSAYLRLLMFLLPILIPACSTSSLAFLMMCSAHRSNKQGESKQPCLTPFSMLNQSVVPYRILTVASWHVYMFLRRQARWWYSHVFKSFPQFIMIHIVKAFGIIDETEVDIFWNSLVFSVIQQMLPILSLVSLPFLNLAWTSGNSWFA